jgi:hypothetical protein
MMAWIKVTDPQGHPIYLSAEQFVRMRPCIAGAGDLASAKSIIDLVSGMQAVKETQEEIIECIMNAGKDDDKAAGA